MISSIKHGPLYYQLMRGDSNIPINIHRILSNFVHIHNLLFKQIIQHYQKFKRYIVDVEGKMNDVNEKFSNIQIIATMENQNKEDKEKEDIKLM